MLKRDRILGLVVVLIFVAANGLVLVLLLMSNVRLKPPFPIFEPGTTLAAWALGIGVLASVYYVIRALMISAGTKSYLPDLAIGRVRISIYLIYASMIPSATGVALFFLTRQDYWSYGLIVLGLIAPLGCFQIAARRASKNLIGRS